MPILANWNLFNPLSFLFLRYVIRSVSEGNYSVLIFRKNSSGNKLMGNNRF